MATIIPKAGGGGISPPIPPKPQVGTPASPLTVTAPKPSDPVIIPSPSFQLAQTFLLYGDTNTRKTTQLGAMVKYCYERYGAPCRMVTVEPNYAHLLPLVEAGLLEIFPIATQFSSVLSLLRALSRGDWLPIRAIGSRVILTPSKKVITPLPDGSATSKIELQSPCSAYFIEGISSIANLLLREVTNGGKKIGEGVVGPFSETSYSEGKELESFAASAPAHYGFSQNTLIDLLANFCALPVNMVGFTAHEGRGKDKYTGAPIYGPLVVGQAATATIPPKIGDMFHLESTIPPNDSTGKPTGPPTVRAYLDKHQDSENSSVLWPATVRWTASALPALWKMYPNRYIDLNFDSIDSYFRLRDKVGEQSVSDLMKWKEEVDRKRKGEEPPQPSSS